MRFRSAGISKPLEFWGLEGGAAYSARSKQAAVAAAVSEVQLFNPAASGIMAFIEDIEIWTPTGAEIQLTDFSTELGAAGGTPINCTNGNGTPAGALARIGTNATVQGNVMYGLFVPANTRIVIDGRYRFALNPGKGLTVAHTTVNIDLTVSFRWVEPF